MAIIPASAGNKVLLTIINGEHSPALLTAMIMPATGDYRTPHSSHQLHW